MHQNEQDLIKVHDGHIPTIGMGSFRNSQGTLSKAGNSLTRLSKVFSLHSLRGRYLWVTACLALVVLGAVWVAELRVRSGAHDWLATDQSRHEIRQNNLPLLADAVWAANNALQRHLFVSDDESHDVLHQNLERARALTQRLQEYDWVRADPESNRTTQVLSAELADLETEIEKAIHLRDDVRELFPASRIQQDILLPANTGFYTAATLAMDEALELSDQPGQHEIYVLFSQTRHAWTKMIGAFRLYIANRFGIFGDPKLGMRAQKDNVDMYGEAVARLLTDLDALNRQGKLEFQQAISLVDMHRFKDTWQTGHRQVVTIYSSDRWRTDLPRLRDNVQPLFNQVWQRLHILDYQLDVASQEDMARLRQATQHLSRYIWLLLSLGLSLIVVGFLLLERNVRRPLVNVAAALRAEAQAVDSLKLPATQVQEIQDLISAFSHTQQQARSRQLRLETILENTSDAIIAFDTAGIVSAFNRAAEKLFGYRAQEVIEENIGLFIAPPNDWKQEKDYVAYFLNNETKRFVKHTGEVLARHKHGNTFPASIKIGTLLIEDRKLYIAFVADSSERKALLDNLAAMAEHDGLTGLYNRVYFQRELQRVVERSKRDEGAYVLLYIDLDNFKFINDTLGHAAGDRLLTEVSKELLKRARRSDLIARFGGDEFTILLYGTKAALGVRVAEDFCKIISDYIFKHNGDTLHVGCSIGVAAIGADSASADEVLSRADLACHLAKRSGRNRVRLFDSEDEADVTTMTQDMDWSRRIKHAVEKGRFVLACQPIIATRTREIASYEVLIRMLDEGDNLVMPGGFLPSAERFGLAYEIDKWVIGHAIGTLVQERQRTPDIRYAINLSAQTLADLSICDLILEELDSSGLDPAALTFEVTETVAIANMNVAVKLLQRLQAIGCKTALDDFGSGMASFAYLRDLPVDIVKIDGRFVKNLAESPIDQAMVKSMNEIVHALGKKTVAEFVENEASFRLLAEYGVDYGQGYHLGKPELKLPSPTVEQKVAAAGLASSGRQT